MEGELMAVRAAAAKMQSARSGEDSLNAMMGVQEMSTLSAGAQAAGVDEERYKFIRSNLSAAVSYLTPPELEGMDTTIASKLAANGITTRDALADLAGDELTELTGLDAAKAQDLIMKARAHWFETPAEAPATGAAA